VRAECLEFALNDEAAFYFGVWGGTSGRDRRKLRKTRNRPHHDDEGGAGKRAA
jgi:hypothetical protein